MFRSAKDRANLVLTDRETDDVELIERLDCDFCTEGGWISDTELVLHQGVTHTDEIIDIINKNPTYCRICLKNCYTSDDLLKHIKTDHLYSSENSFRVQREIFVCDICTQIFFNKHLLLVHISHIHMRNTPNSSKIPCPKCPKRVSIKAFWFHFQAHGIKSVSTCPVCLTKCKTRNNVLIHMKSHPRLLRCEMCLYETKREDLFRQHILSKHKMSVLCPETDRNVDSCFIPISEPTWKYRRLTGLQGLELTNGLRICIFCREICIGKSKMREHIYVDHNLKEELWKPAHACSCGEVFTNKVLLKHHTFKLKGNHKMMSQK